MFDNNGITSKSKIERSVENSQIFENCFSQNSPEKRNQ